MNRLFKIFLLILLVVAIIFSVWIIFAIIKKPKPVLTEAPTNNSTVVEDVELTISATDVSDSALANDLLVIDKQMGDLNKYIAFAEQALSSVKTTDQSSEKKNLGVSINTLKSMVDSEIAQKIKNFNDLLEKVNLMKRISNRQQNSLSGSIQAEIDELTTLKKKIDEEVNLALARADYQEIINSYKTYNLINQQAWILLAGDKEAEILSSMNVVGGKVQLRMENLTGANAITIKNILKNFTSKISSASAKSKSAINEISLLGAQGAVTDLQSARNDLGTIIKYLREISPK